MKPVIAIQEVQVLPRAKPSQQPSSRTRWPEETKVRSRGRRVVGVCIEPRKMLESGGPVRDKRTRVMPDLSEANSGQCDPPGTQQPPGNMASRCGGHRGRRPDHDDTGIARELARASSASCLYRRGTKRGNPGESTATSKLPTGKARRSAGSILAIKRGDDRYEGTSWIAEEPRKSVRQS
jgi:hypothetical protein